MIAIIDYDMGNIRSVENALRRAGAEWILTADPDTIRRADRVILPGVGHCGEAMTRLRERGLTEVICSLRRPVLGICVGMQVMCRHSEEGDTECLGLFDTRVRQLPATATCLSAPRLNGRTSPARSFIRRRAATSANRSSATFSNSDIKTPP